MMSIQHLVRDNIRSLVPYSSARSEFKGQASVFLDANESPYSTGYNRYPDPLQWKLKDKIAKREGVRTDQIFLGNGSDEAIDLLIRIFCEPGFDHIITLPPTYGMYQVSAAISAITIQEVLLDQAYEPRVKAILEIANANSKLLFLCSPNNPTGNSFSLDKIKKLAASFPGITVVDEAYIDFAAQESTISLLSSCPRLVVMKTFSKAWGLAGIRLGMAFASSEIIELFNKVKPPYNINQLTQDAALAAMQNEAKVKEQVGKILEERLLMRENLKSLDYIEQVYPSDANFILVKMKNPRGIYRYLVEQGIIVRDRSKVALCDGCLRITIGTSEENEQLYKTLLTYQN